ncbi:hypothetical protein HanXRQr2_Chr02g0066761 [Helianthus annuus]|uniref:Uncharacterized protein n=1 Tax=Helianthus annuus TaxID=4232 RepID=A0A9K3JMR7_HELAN|nr:hypothetical protein HanXRQr2_Chr02g0066761 [Helianthus annuus]KAJ0951883.1 hypothetical protein HanPSC8_Chr02g0065611 [Helianthus annuus]
MSKWYQIPRPNTPNRNILGTDFWIFGTGTHFWDFPYQYRTHFRGFSLPSWYRAHLCFLTTWTMHCWKSNHVFPRMTNQRGK